MRPIGGLLRAAAAAALVLGALAAAVPGDAGTAIGTAAVGVVIAAPLLRVAWLAKRFVREGDDRFALLALALLAVVATGAVLALLT